MSVCAHRGNEEPGFFTPCRDCPCSAEVKAELENEAQREGAERRPNDNGGRG